MMQLQKGLPAVVVQNDKDLPGLGNLAGLF